MKDDKEPIPLAGVFNPVVAYGAPTEDIDYKKKKPSAVDIVMVDPGPYKIKCIKLMRDVSYELGDTFTIQESKDKLKPMSVVFHSVIYREAKEIRDRFTEINAKVSFIVVYWH